MYPEKDNASANNYEMYISLEDNNDVIIELRGPKEDMHDVQLTLINKGYIIIKVIDDYHFKACKF